MGLIHKLLGLKELPPAEVHAVDDTNFSDLVTKSEVPVLLDVWSESCVPCRQLAPIVTRLSREYAGRLRVAELDVARAPHLAGRLHVRGTPTVIYFHKGREVERVVGFRGSLYHQDFIENELLPRAEGAQAHSA